MADRICSKETLCIGCNRCVRECPMEMANVTYQDTNGDIKVKTDPEKCIACGRCVSACTHKARYYADDTERFFTDLSEGVSISLIVAPAIRTNIPEWKKLFTYLKRMGVRKIYDASLGADICIWAHVRYLEREGHMPIITQPCPVVVMYCEKYRHNLLKYLAPIHSPMGCISVYMREYEGIQDHIAALSPCIAKADEFEKTHLAQYNVTFPRLLDYLSENGVTLPEEETGFDHDASGLGSLFPMSGGLTENIEYFLGKTLNLSRIEGIDVFERLDAYSRTPEDLLPDVLDVLNCQTGCNIGSASSFSDNIFQIDKTMNESRKMALENRKRAYFQDLYHTYDSKFNPKHFIRTYRPIYSEFPDITEEDIAKAFDLLDKVSDDDRSVDCGACGSGTCHDMARKIALGVNSPVNCMLKTMQSAKKEHEINLNTLEQLEMIWGHVESGIAIIDAETRKILDVNPAAIRMYGDGGEKMIGETCYAFFGQHECPIMDLNQALDRAERKFMKSDGTVIPVLKSVSKILYRGRIALLESFTDISSLKDAEEKSHMLEVSEQANKAKSAFLANMSHEIRTPMNAILGIAEIQLQDESLTPEIREALSKIYSSGDLLLGIINDILDLSKIEAGKLELVVDSYDTASLINDTVQLNIMRIGSKPIEFELFVDEHTPSNLLGDELRIKQILNNTLSNAFKYTNEGKVQLYVSSEAGDAPDVTLLVLRVSDTGQGMSKEQVDKLFDEYSRFNLQANRTTEGTGLGMSITQNLIRMMKGRISVESEPGRGSEFTIYLPQGSVGPGVLGKDLAENLRQFRQGGKTQMKRVQISREPMPYGSVLIVDDVETNIYVAKGLLAPYGLTIDSADSGFAAIEKIKQNRTYDIVFMDHMMPKMDGIEATKIMRELGYTQPVVALTANAVVGQSDMFLNNGFDDFISKPIDIRQMNMVLNRLIRDKQPPEVLEKARRQAEMAKNAMTAKAAPAALDPRFAVIFARDAKKALAVLDAICGKEGVYSEEDMRTYIINVHGMKSALANIGEKELSAVALKLEKAAREGLTNIMTAETAAFLDDLRALVDTLVPEDKQQQSDTGSEDKGYLREKLPLILSACEAYDDKALEDVLGTLTDKAWASSTQALLSQIGEYLLHSDFDEIAHVVNNFMEAL